MQKEFIERKGVSYCLVRSSQLLSLATLCVCLVNMLLCAKCCAPAQCSLRAARALHLKAATLDKVNHMSAPPPFYRPHATLATLRQLPLPPTSAVGPRHVFATVCRLLRQPKNASKQTQRLCWRGSTRKWAETGEWGRVASCA